MSTFSGESLPAIPNDIGEHSIGPIVHDFQEQTEAARLAHMAALEHPEYIEIAFKVAAKLFPNDPEKRRAFLDGTELSTALERQHATTAELMTLLLGNYEETIEQPPKPRRVRRFFAAKIALVAVGAVITGKSRLSS